MIVRHAANAQHTGAHGGSATACAQHSRAPLHCTLTRSSQRRLHATTSILKENHMSPASDLRIAVLPGDGIGVEVMEACLPVVEAAARKLNCPPLSWNRLSGGAAAYRDTGNAFTDDAMREVERADAILFGAMGLPEVRYPDGTEIAPQLDIRMALDLYAGVRPIRALP